MRFEFLTTIIFFTALTTQGVRCTSGSTKTTSTKNGQILFITFNLRPELWNISRQKLKENNECIPKKIENQALLNQMDSIQVLIRRSKGNGKKLSEVIHSDDYRIWGMINATEYFYNANRRFICNDSIFENDFEMLQLIMKNLFPYNYDGTKWIIDSSGIYNKDNPPPPPKE